MRKYLKLYTKHGFYWRVKIAGPLSSHKGKEWNPLDKYKKILIMKVVNVTANSAIFKKASFSFCKQHIKFSGSTTHMSGAGRKLK